MRLEELMQALNYAKKGRGRDLLIQEQLKQSDPYNLQNMMVLEKNKDLQFVDRVLNPEQYPTPTLMDGNKMQTHVMAAEQDEDGNWVAFPNVIMKDGEYKKFNNTDQAMKYAKDNNQIINFGKGENAKQKALNFSINYKPESFKRYYEDVQKNMGGLLS